MRIISAFYLIAASTISRGAAEPGHTVIPLPETHIERTVPGRFGIDTFSVGMDTGSPGSPGSNTSKPPFAFIGTIDEVCIELK